MRDGDVLQVHALLKKFMSKYSYYHYLDEKEVAHFFRCIENVIYSYVVEVSGPLRRSLTFPEGSREPRDHRLLQLLRDSHCCQPASQTRLSSHRLPLLLRGGGWAGLEDVGRRYFDIRTRCLRLFLVLNL